MLSVSLDYDKPFVSLYNNFNNNTIRKQYLKLLGISRDKLDISTMSKNYFLTKKSIDMSIDQNSNTVNGRSHNNYQAEVVKGLQKLNAYYVLWDYAVKYFKKVENKTKKKSIELANELIEEIWNGSLYLHDSHLINICYCFAFSTYNILTEGRPYGALKSKPPKKTDSFIGQCIETTMDLSQEHAGAIALADIFINYSWFANNERLDLSHSNDIKKIENDFQKLVHILSSPFRVGGQSPFTNVSLFDYHNNLELFGDLVYPDGLTGKELIEKAMRIQEIFLKFFAKKDPLTGAPYRFPIVTANISINNEKEINDNDFFNLICENNTEGVLNLFVTSDTAKVASCCRLISDVGNMEKIRGIDSFGNGGVNIGSSRIVTINLARIGKEAGGSMKKFNSILKHRFEISRRILKVHQYLIKNRVDQGFLKFFNPLKWQNLEKMFYGTFGISGLSESIESFGYKVSEYNGQRFAIKVMENIGNIVSDFNKKENSDGISQLYNIEQVPAEGASITLSKMDSIYFGEYENYPHKLYSNQFVPLWENIDLYERVVIDGKLNRYFTGGCISHLNLSSKATPEQIQKLIKFSIRQGLEHFALNPLFSKCEKNHVMVTDSKVCPSCGSMIKDQFTRVVGYFVPVSNFSKERFNHDFKKRRWRNLGKDSIIDNIRKYNGKVDTY